MRAYCRKAADPDFDESFADPTSLHAIHHSDGTKAEPSGVISID